MRNYLTLALILGSSAAFAQNTPPVAIPQPPAVVQQAVSETTGAWAQQAIELVVSKGLFVGYPKGQFDWSQAATRQEVAMVFARLLQKYPLDQLQNFLTKNELTIFENGLKEVQDGLAELRARLDAQEANLVTLQEGLDEVQTTLADLQSQLEGFADLPDRVAALEESQVAQDDLLTDLDGRVGALEESQAAQDDLIADLQSQIDGIEPGVDSSEAIAALEESQAAQDDLLGELDGRLSALEESQGVQDDAIAELQSQVEPLADAPDRLTALEESQAAQDDMLSDNDSRLSALEEGLSDLNARLSALEEVPAGMDGVDGVAGATGPAGPAGANGAAGAVGATGPVGPAGEQGEMGEIGEQGDQGEMGDKGDKGDKGDTGAQGIQGLQGVAGKDFTPAAEPYRAPFFVGISGYGVGSPSTGISARVTIGNDALLGNFGVRLTGDFGVSGITSGTSVVGGVSYRATLGMIDGYGAVGLGQNLTTSSPFGDLIVGVNIRLNDFLGVFAEGRQNFFFNSGLSVSSVAFGVQIRF